MILWIAVFFIFTYFIFSFVFENRSRFKGGVQFEYGMQSASTSRPTQHHSELPLLLGSISAQCHQEHKKHSTTERERQIHAAFGAASQRALQMQRVLVSDHGRQDLPQAQTVLQTRREDMYHGRQRYTTSSERYYGASSGCKHTKTKNSHSHSPKAASSAIAAGCGRQTIA